MSVSFPNTYAIPGLDHEHIWEELDSLALGLFEVKDEMPRNQWLALGFMANGKAQLIEQGRYDMGDEDNADNADWATDLRHIAHTVFDYFKPGDGKL